MPLAARPLRLAAFALLALAVGCGGGDETAQAPVPSGWIDVAGMSCADGSPTGIGISRGDASRVLVFLSGGGACWSETECDAQLRSFGRAEFNLFSLLVTGTIFDRTLSGNPFAGWTLVFVPYCTGDVHAGDSQQVYGTQGAWNHHGKRNLDAALDRVKGLFPSPEKLVVTGSSAGGFGSLLAFELARARWVGGGPSSAKAYLVDDSGPTFVGAELPAAIRDAWWASWNLDATITPLCAGCKTDLSEIWTTLAANHAGDRLALLSPTEDGTIRGFFGGMDAATFSSALDTLAAKLAGLPAAKTFRVGGAQSTAHALLLAPGTYTAGSTPLLGWLGQMVGDDAAWSSAGP